MKTTAKIIAALIGHFALVTSAQQTYFVTTLADGGRGSLRDAVSRGNRKISFKVGGSIELKKMLEIKADNISIDGSTAPAPGITVRRKTFSVTDASNITLRHLRFRYADNDSLRIVGACRNILIENCSATHGGDGALDITHDWKRTAKRPNGVTVRNCLIAATDKAMLIVGVDDLTVEQNLFTNTGQRNPQLHDVRNFNLINNHIRNFTVYGVRARAGSTGNVIGNLIPLSPLLPKRPDRTFLIDHKSGKPCHVYTHNNIGPRQHDPNRQGNRGRPISPAPTRILPAPQLPKLLSRSVGAQPLDSIDRALVADNPQIKFRPSNTADK